LSDLLADDDPIVHQSIIIDEDGQKDEEEIKTARIDKTIDGEN
jgi:hypothetical protein